jgi:hypothetical protein
VLKELCVVTQDKRTEMEAVRYFETSVNCFHCALFKIPEECNNVTVNLLITGPQGTNVSRCKQVSFHTRTRILDPEESRASVQ